MSRPLTVRLSRRPLRALVVDIENRPLSYWYDRPTAEVTVIAYKWLGDARPVVAPFNVRILLPWFGYSGYKLFVIAASVVLIAATWLVLTRTKIGLVMRATQYDRETAQAFGVPVDRVYAGVFALGAMLAAVAAVLIVPIQQAHYLMGLDPLLLSFIVVIIGGLGSLRGTVVAALLIGVSDGIVSVFFSPTLAKIIATLAVAMVLVFRPQGLFGTVSR